MDKILKYTEKSTRYNVIGRFHIEFQLEYQGNVSRKSIQNYIEKKRPNAVVVYIKKISKGFLKGKVEAYDTPEKMKYYKIKK